MTSTKAERRDVFLPGSTIGMLGGGQLGRMFAMAAHAMGYRVVVFDSEKYAPAAMAADESVTAPFDDRNALKDFAERCDLVTLEWENIPTAFRLLIGFQWIDLTESRRSRSFQMSPEEWESMSPVSAAG